MKEVLLDSTMKIFARGGKAAVGEDYLNRGLIP